MATYPTLGSLMLPTFTIRINVQWLEYVSLLNLSHIQTTAHYEAYQWTRGLSMNSTLDWPLISKKDQYDCLTDRLANWMNHHQIIKINRIEDFNVPFLAPVISPVLPRGPHLLLGGQWASFQPMIPGGSRTAVFGTVGKRSNRYPTRPYKQIEQKIINTEIKMK